MLVVMLAFASGCRSAFADEKPRPKMHPHCTEPKSARIVSPDKTMTAWRSRDAALCWEGRGQDVSVTTIMAEPIADESGIIHFTPDGRALTWHGMVPIEGGDYAWRLPYPVTVYVDVRTGLTQTIPDEPGADTNWVGGRTLSPQPPPPRLVRRPRQ